MAETTKIQWCDSTLNLMAGCDGCELWNPKTGNKHCYAGVMTNVYGGRPGWPDSFDKPKLFTERLDKALRWSDLTGKERPDKSWLNGLPRMIFLNDMGDTFTESLPLDWLAPLLPRMADSPHVFMLLTKRGSRMRLFSEMYPLPANFWPGVSVTTQKSLPRVGELFKVLGGGVKWVSAEPLLEPVKFDWCEHPDQFCDGLIDPLTGWVSGDGNYQTWRDEKHRIGLVICGGESGPKARPFDLAWARSLRDQCRAANVPYFLKQLGSNPVAWKPSHEYPSDGSVLPLTPGMINDSHGGDQSEWPADLQGCREFPKGVTNVRP